MKLLFPLLFLFAIILPAQAADPNSGDEQREVEVPMPNDATHGGAPEADEQEAPTVQLPEIPLTPGLLYQILLGEISGQRGNLTVATSAYLNLAKATRDPRIIRRGTEIAVYARMPQVALELSKLWTEVEPKSIQARNNLAVMLVNLGRLDEAKPHLAALLDASKANIGHGALQLGALLARVSDRAAVYRLAKELLAPWPDVAEARYVEGQAAGGAGLKDEALAAAHAANKLRPDWEQPVLLEAQVLQKDSLPEALARLKRHLDAYPQAKDIRLAYARTLVASQDLPEARRQFQRLLEDFPDNADVKYAVALLSMQLADFPSAERYFKGALEGGHKDKDLIRLYLGQIAEDGKRLDEAAGWYQQVEQGEQYLMAQIRYAGVLAKKGGLDQGLNYLHGLSGATGQQRAQLALAEAQFLRNAKEFTRAFEVLAKELKAQPEQPDLLYDYAMSAERLGKVDVLESSLKKLIGLRPDHAHAYNALGYTLADRGLRLDEARGYVEKALELSPEDPFILDSMGWVSFRLGQLDKALEYLNKAFRIKPDPEIAAHLGEVLWAKGKRQEAEKVWRDALATSPAHEVLEGVIHKFLQ